MEIDPGQIIRRVMMTEKGAMQREQGKTGPTYYFEVHPSANKITIAHAIRAAFGVDVACVRTMNYGGKRKRMGRYEGPRASWKKAVVTLKPGQRIEQFDEV
ncbi:MAG: 50S ribosomal protein L23 [Candidatus Eisenbacteria bacterium]|nr:50S ribosomal protein L23 [Candidatus Eisenbacteria bacterium]